MSTRVVYPYPDSRGRLLLQKVRREFTPPSTDDNLFPATVKKFWMEGRRRVDFAWVSPRALGRSDPDLRDYFHRLLYGMPALRRALPVSEAMTLYWTEGEKDADAINALGRPGVLATTHWQGGGNASWSQAYRLTGWRGRVVVCADVDEVGAACAWRRYSLLREFGIAAGRLSVVRPAGRTYGSRAEWDGRDVADHLADGYALDALLPMDLHKLEELAARLQRSGRRLRGSGSTS